MKSYPSAKEVKVSIDFGNSSYLVGRLALSDSKIYFEYDDNFIKKGLEISPLRLPLKAGLQSFDYSLFEGLPGVFNDSLPDGWGRLLLDRFVRSQGISPSYITPLDRLAHLGSHALGALIFEPDYSENEERYSLDLDYIALQSQEVLDGAADDVLANLIDLNGSSAGARPKALIGVNDKRNNVIHGAHDLLEGYEPWIVKFPNNHDGIDAGAIEYVYALMAKDAGVIMSDVHLFPAKNGAGYFATKRFDRCSDKRYHMHTACGLLHSDFRAPSLDYEDLIALTGVLTRDVREVEKMYRLAVFNVLSHNRDDHSKNFSYLMDSEGSWKLSPAYDLTFSYGPRGEQSTMVMGEGANPSVSHLLSLAKEANIKKDHAVDIIDSIKASLSKWPILAKEYGVSDANIRLIQEAL